MKIYLVIGQTGEYSDQVKWYLHAFTKLKDANKLVKLAQAEADKIFRYQDGKFWNVIKRNKYDKQMQMDYTGTTYKIEKVEFE